MEDRTNLSRIKALKPHFNMVEMAIILTTKPRKGGSPARDSKLSNKVNF